MSNTVWVVLKKHYDEYGTIEVVGVRDTQEEAEQLADSKNTRFSDTLVRAAGYE